VLATLRHGQYATPEVRAAGSAIAVDRRAEIHSRAKDFSIQASEQDPGKSDLVDFQLLGEKRTV
jgi:hypothetical protein